jgi:hypothetical protein
MNEYVVTDVYSTELGIRLSFVKTLEFRGRGLNTQTPLGTPLTRSDRFVPVKLRL